MPKPPTIIDVARRARVSMKTVSRALNDEPYVSVEARTRVMDAARALNYRPNLFARSLASRRSFLIGLICAPPSPAPVYVMTIQEGILAQCEPAGYNLLTKTFDPGARGVARKVLQFVEKSRVDGLIVTPPLADNRTLTRALVEAGIAHVRISQADLVSGSPRLGTDEAGISKELTSYLISLGHERIGFIKGHPSHSGSRDRLDGFEAAMREAGLEPDDKHIEQGMFSFESGFECGMRLLSLGTRPTAIFASNDYMAAGVVNAAHHLGIAMPAELSVAGFDDAPVARQIWPSLTTIRQPVRRLGELATIALTERIADRENVGRSDVPSCELVVRESTGPRR